jgi:formate hydrogenlyase subunit 6/NADH:ubiquinone oxidoreductase subunit I
MAIREKVAKVVPGGGTSTPPPDLDPRNVSIDRNKLIRQRKRTFGIGLLKGMAVTLRHLFKHNTVIQYPDEKQDLAPRTRGVIALKEENCTVCMLCGRECPDWCIYIDSHKETLPPKREGGRPRKRNVLDRFAIDYALCMYCGICVEVCPYDALFWSREFEYAELDIRELTHEKERLSDWMASVLPPPALEDGADLPGAPAAAAGGTGPGAAQRPSPPAAATAAATRPEQAARPPAAAATAAPAPPAATPSQEQAGETKAPAAEARVEPTEEKAPKPAAEQEAATEEAGRGPGDVQAEAVKTPTEAKSPAQREKPPDAKAVAAREEAKVGESTATATPAETIEYQETPGTNVAVPHEEPRPVALEKTEDPEKVYEQVLKEQLDAGSSPQVAEARAKVARVKAERGIKRGPTPIQTDKMVPSAPTKGAPREPKPSGAPDAREPQPPQGPVAPTPVEEKKANEEKGPDG